MPSLQTTNHEDGQKGKQDGKADQGNKRCREADGPPVAEPIGLAVLGESAQLPGFGGIALDREHAPEVVAQPGCQIPGPFAHLPVAGGQPLLKAQGSPEDHGDRNEGHPRHHGREEHHRATDGQHGGEELQDFIGSLIEKALELVDVVVEDRHQAAGAALLKEGHLQLLEVAIGLLAQLMLNGLGQVAPEQGVEIFKERLRAPNSKGEHGQHAQLAGHRAHTPSREPGGVLLHHHIHGQADQHRWRQVEQLVQDRTGCR